MPQTVTIDIINDKAIKLIEDLELLKLIRVHKNEAPKTMNYIERYKGAMSKQSLPEVDSQLQELRNSWE